MQFCVLFCWLIFFEILSFASTKFCVKCYCWQDCKNTALTQLLDNSLLQHCERVDQHYNSTGKLWLKSCNIAYLCVQVVLKSVV